MGQKSLLKGCFGGQESITVWIWVTLRYDTTTDLKLPDRNWIAGTKYEVGLPNNLFGFRVIMLQVTYEIN